MRAVPAEAITLSSCFSGPARQHEAKATTMRPAAVRVLSSAASCWAVQGGDSTPSPCQSPPVSSVAGRQHTAEVCHLPAVEQCARAERGTLKAGKARTAGAQPERFEGSSAGQRDDAQDSVGPLSRSKP